MSNETLKDIKERRSVRKFTDRKIDKKILEEIVDAGRVAPSARAIHPVEFIVITEKETLEKIADATFYGKHIKNAAVCIVVVAEKVKRYVEDGCASTENILLAAKSFGIGSCWVAGYNTAYEWVIKKILNIPEDFGLISLIPLGYPAESPKPHRKKELEKVLHWEKF